MSERDREKLLTQDESSTHGHVQTQHSMCKKAALSLSAADSQYVSTELPERISIQQRDYRKKGRFM